MIIVRYADDVVAGFEHEDDAPMKVNPKKLKVSGLPSPRRSRLTAAWRPNSIRRVLSGCSDSANSSNLARIASRNRRVRCIGGVRLSFGLLHGT